MQKYKWKRIAASCHDWDPPKPSLTRLTTATDHKWGVYFERRNKLQSARVCLSAAGRRASTKGAGMMPTRDTKIAPAHGETRDHRCRHRNKHPTPCRERGCLLIGRLPFGERTRSRARANNTKKKKYSWSASASQPMVTRTCRSSSIIYCRKHQSSLGCQSRRANKQKTSKLRRDLQSGCIKTKLEILFFSWQS